MRCIGGWLLFVSAAIAGPDADELVELLSKALESGVAAGMEGYIDGGEIEAMLRVPRRLCRLCESAAKGARGGELESKNDWGAAMERLQSLAQSVCDTMPDDALALRAHGAAMLARARVKDLLKEEGGSELRQSAAERFLLAQEKNGLDGTSLEWAVEALLEAAAQPGADAKAIRARVRELCDRGGAKYPKSGLFREVGYRTRLDGIAEQLAADRNGGKKALEAYFAELKPLAFGKEPDESAAAAHNDAVTLVRQTKGIGIGVEYAFRTQRSSQELLAFDLPYGKRWQYAKDGGDLGCLRQFDASGRLLRRIDFDEYDWDRLYTYEGFQAGGDNLQGLAKIGEFAAKQLIPNVTSQKPLRKTRFNRYVAQAQCFEVIGLDEDSDPLGLRRFYFKAKGKARKTYRVDVIEYGENPKLDPEADFVLDRIRENDGR